MPNGSVTFQLNVDGTVIAAPGGFVAADIEIVFQFNAAGQIQQTLSDGSSAPAKIYSNAELEPQNSIGLGTYYLVTFYDQNGARLNVAPMWWQFPEAANATVDISQIIPISTVGGNVIFYPTSFLSGVTSVTFTGDGTVLSSTPSLPVTSTGTLTAALNTQSANTVLAGPASGPIAAPTFRSLVLADLPSGYNSWSSLTNATQALVLANTTFATTFSQTTPLAWTWSNVTAAISTADASSPSVNLTGQYWSGSVSGPDTWSVQNFLYRGAVYILTAAGNASSSKTLYTVAASDVNPLPPIGATILVAGFSTSANNGSFTVADNRSGSFILNNSGGVAENHTATATVTTEATTAGSLVFTHPLGVTNSQILIPQLSGSVPDLAWIGDPNTGFTYLGSSQLKLSCGPSTNYVFTTSTFLISGVGNITFGGGNAEVISGVLDPHNSYVLSAASNASFGNTTYTGTFSPTISVGAVVNISGFLNGGNNVGNALVVSCSSTMLVVVNAGGILETHPGVAATTNPAIYIGTGGTNSTGFTATLGLPILSYDPPTTGTFTASQTGRMWYNTVDRQAKLWGGTTTKAIVAATNITASGLTANYNAGSAATIFTPTAATRLRVTATQAITVAATTGATTSTLPSLTLGYTDVGGIARTVQMLATSATNTTAVYETASELIYTDGSTPVTVTSASYASDTAAQMTYYLIVTSEIV